MIGLLHGMGVSVENIGKWQDFSTEWALWWITLSSNTMNRWYYLIKIVDNWLKYAFFCAPPTEYTTSVGYRSSAAGGSAKGPSSRLTIAPDIWLSIACLSVAFKIWMRVVLACPLLYYALIISDLCTERLCIPLGQFIRRFIHCPWKDIFQMISPLTSFGRNDS